MMDKLSHPLRCMYPARRLHPGVDVSLAGAALELVLMDLHHRFAGLLRAHPGRVDFAVMTMLFLLLVVPVVILAVKPIEMLASAGLVLPLLWRRSRPVFSAGLVAAVSVLQIIFYVIPVPAQVAVLIILYALAAHAPRWASLGGLAVASVGCFAGLLRYSADFGISPFEVSASLPLFAIVAVLVEALVLLCWAFGDLARNRRLTLQALEDRTRRLEVERQQERDLAAADERSHIALEMHDIVAHSLSVIITQADGARYASAQDHTVAPATLGTIAETGRSSLREMRRLLGVLRGDEETSTRPLPALADIAALIETVQHAGLSTTYAVTGTNR